MTVKVRIQERRNERCTNWRDVDLSPRGDDGLGSGLDAESRWRDRMQVAIAVLENISLGWEKYRIIWPTLCQTCGIRDVELPGDDTCAECMAEIERETDALRGESPYPPCEYPNCDRRCMQTVNGTGLCNWHATEYQADLESHGKLICCKCMWVVSEDSMGNLVDPSGSTSCEGDGVHRLSDDDRADDEENEALMNLRAKLEGRQP